MRNTILSLITVVSLLSSPVMVMAQANVASPAAGVRQEVADKRITNLQTRGIAEIDRRLVSLNSWSNRITANKTLSAANKAAILQTMQAEIANLTALKAKIAADTDLATLRTDVKSIVDSYRVYMLVMPQAQLMVASDRVINTASEMATISAQLAVNLQTATPSGVNAKAVQATLADLNAKIADAQKQAAAVEAAILPLTPTTANFASVLGTSRGLLQTAIGDLKMGRIDIKSLLAAVTPSANVTATGSAGLAK